MTQQTRNGKDNATVTAGASIHPAADFEYDERESSAESSLFRSINRTDEKQKRGQQFSPRSKGATYLRHKQQQQQTAHSNQSPDQNYDELEAEI